MTSGRWYLTELLLDLVTWCINKEAVTLPYYNNNIVIATAKYNLFALK